MALKWTMKHFYNVEPGEVFWSASDVGWVVGHSYIVYAPLLHGCTTIVFEGKPVGTPDPGTFWRVIEQHRVPTLFTAPTALRAIKREDPDAELPEEVRPLPLPRALPGGRAVRPRHHPLGREPPEGPGDRPLVADRDRLGHRRQPAGHPALPGQVRLGHQAHAGLRPARARRRPKELPRGEIGALVSQLPLPPGTLMTLWNADERF